MKSFEGVRIIDSKLGALKHGAALALPGKGIYLSLDFYGKRPKRFKQLLRHEFGHFLQARKHGYFYFYFVIALISLISAKFARVHQHTWTEREANTLAYNYFNQPDDWDLEHYPVNE